MQSRYLFPVDLLESLLLDRDMYIALLDRIIEKVASTILVPNSDPGVVYLGTRIMLVFVTIASEPLFDLSTTTSKL